MKLIKFFLSMLLVLTALSGCQRKTQERLFLSESTMNQIILFTDQSDQLLNFFEYIPKNSPHPDLPLLQDEGIYKTKENADETALNDLLKKPLALAYLFSIHGMGQKLGLTDCQDPFTMIKMEHQLLQKALTLFSQEEIDKAYLNAIDREKKKIAKKN